MSFLVKAKKLGLIAIKIQATSSLENDALEHMLRVTPESYRMEDNVARFIELPTFDKKEFPINLNVPKRIDEGSTQIIFTLDREYHYACLYSLYESMHAYMYSISFV